MLVERHLHSETPTSQIRRLRSLIFQISLEVSRPVVSELASYSRHFLASVASSSLSLLSSRIGSH